MNGNAPKTETRPVLSVANLTTSFLRQGRYNAVLKGISFDIGPRETVAIVGESGSGKSVTALSVMGLNAKATSRVEGTIKLDGRDLLSLPEAEMRKIRGNEIAMIFQEPMTSLNPVLTVGEQIAESLMLHRGMGKSEARAETLRLMDKVRIPAASSRIDEYPHRFSGGMRQRIMISLALACRPKLLIADEPTTALDVTIQSQILDLIRSLQDEEGMSVLFITHDMGVVAEIADRTIVMYKGDIVETGDSADLFREPKAAYTKALLSAVPRLGSMDGKSQPMRFPVVDKTSGEAETPLEMSSTVDAAKKVLEVRNLVTRFDIRGGFLGSVTGRVHAVENVSFDLKSGETLALVGESGCGKSTTGRSIMRLIEPSSGSITVNGKDVMSAKGDGLREMRRDMQMIFQDPYASLDPRKTVGASIMEPLLVHDLASDEKARNIVAGLLEQVGLSADMAGRYPHEFSGGQRQRVCIARALSLNPKLMIADEAVSALDVSIKAQVVNLMLDLQKSLGLSYLFISHDMAVVERISHRVAVMYLGEIVEIGPRAAVFGNPQHPYTRRLISAVPVPDPSRRGQRNRIPDSEIKSPVRPADYRAPLRQYREISPGHLVQAGENGQHPG